MKRRDFLLQQMGITQWQLTNPAALAGAVNIQLDAKIRLLIVAEQKLELSQPLLQDVLRSLELTHDECAVININQLAYVKTQSPLNCWQLLDKEQKNSLNSDHLPISHLWQSPKWAEFCQSPQAKRQFWQQIQQSKHD